MTNNGEGLFGVGVGGGTSSPAMRVAYGGADGTAVYKSMNSSPPPPYQQHHQPSSGGGIDVPSEAAMHGLNMNVVMEGGSDHHNHHQQQQQPMMMMKKKRGRPRKYSGGTDGTMSLALMPANTSTDGVAGGPSPPPPPPPPQAVPAAGGGAFSSPPSSFKKARGRPPGSTNKNTSNNVNKHFQHIQQPQLGSAGFGFTPHVISVKAGEDVSSKIMSFSQNGPRAVCILSANGAISNVTLRQAATSGGTATYEGRFEILSLCGSFLLTEIAGQRSRTGGLSVSLASPDGRVLGGCVAGLLTAASPVQVIVGSFIPDGGRKESKVAAPNHHNMDPTVHLSSPPPPQNPMPMSMQPMLFQGSGGGGGLTSGGVSESSHGGSLSDSSGGEGNSPPNHTTGGNTPTNHHHQHHNNNNNNQPQGLMGMPWR